MKKYLFFAAAALALASCSEQVDFTQESLQTQNEGPTAVQFGTYLGSSSQTRAGYVGDITTTEFEAGQSSGTQGFGVFAYYTSNQTWTAAQTTAKPNFMYNQQVYKSSSVWAYTPVKYWPNEFAAGNVDGSGAKGETARGYVSFFAYSPYVSGTVNLSGVNYTFEPASGRFKSISNEYYDAQAGASGILRLTGNDDVNNPKVTYRLDLTNPVDLLWGKRPSSTTYTLAAGTDAGSSNATNIDLTKQTLTETVDFVFQHTLARIGGNPIEISSTKHGGVWVALDIDDNTHASTTTREKDADENFLTLVTINNLTIKNTTDGSDNDGNIKDGGVFDLYTGLWDLTSSSDLVINDEATYQSSSSAVGIADDLAEPTTAPTFTTGSGKGWSQGGVTETLQEVYKNKKAYYIIPSPSDQKLRVSITYTVRTYDPKLVGSCSAVTQTITKDITFTNGLEANKIYRLNIYLGLTSVKFTASVIPWNDANNDGTVDADVVKEVDLPINVSD